MYACSVNGQLLPYQSDINKDLANIMLLLDWSVMEIKCNCKSKDNQQ